jgi:DNA-binding FadR family transcriptional regulator
VGTTRKKVDETNVAEPPTRSREIAASLMRRILAGEYPVGAKLPSERDLAVEFGATRNVVREGLKRLEAVGIVRVLRGSGVYVRSPQFTAGIELFDALVTREDGSPNIALLKDVLEFRADIARMLVRLAAERRTDEEFAQMRELVKLRETHKDDPEKIADASVKLFRAIAYATHNIVCQLMFNTVEMVSAILRKEIDFPVLGYDLGQDIFERLLDAFERKDDVMAELVVIRYVEAVSMGVSLGGSSSGLLHFRNVSAGK